MKADKQHQFSGIYCIRNLINQKVYIGKSINIYKRIHDHLDKLKKKSKDENPYLTNSWYKYRNDNFEYFVVEKCEGEVLIASRELFWMKHFDSLNREKGYNLRSDSDSKMIVHESTKKKISDRLKKEWSLGVRSEHGKKLSDNWKTTPERNAQQSKVMSKALTKYFYIVNGEKLSYQDLVKSGLKNAIGKFWIKKSDTIVYKGISIERVSS